MAICKICRNKSDLISKSPGICLNCIRQHPKKVLKISELVHAAHRKTYNLPVMAPKVKNGVACGVCNQKCVFSARYPGYCGKETESSTIGNLSYYHDPHPVNCVSSWVCPGATSSGFPEFTEVKGCEYDKSNLAVFFNSCNFNCLYCQNHDFRDLSTKKGTVSVDDLINAIKPDNTCICFFGGDPTPQIRFALTLGDKILDKNIKIRICWETNGSMKGTYLDKMVSHSIRTGGIIKFDLKAWNDTLHRVLTGAPNGRVLENFRRAAQKVSERPGPPLLMASTLLVPGYIDVDEISKISGFIAKINPEIPYTLLGFSPAFHMPDLPKGTHAYAEECLSAAKASGLKRVRLENEVLFV